MSKERNGFDMWINGCSHCEVADGVLAAYRHAIKDVIRAETFDEAKAVMWKALDNDHMKRLGKVFHMIVKDAVILAALKKNQDSEDFKKAFSDLCTRIDEMNHGATVRGWVKDGPTA